MLDQAFLLGWSVDRFHARALENTFQRSRKFLK